MSITFPRRRSISTIRGCAPMSSFACQATAFGWRKEKLAEDAQQIARLGRELYRRLAAMGGHVVDLGKGLEGAVRHYNSFVGSLESRVMPQARRFNELEVDGAQDALPEL